MAELARAIARELMPPVGHVGYLGPTRELVPQPVAPSRQLDSKQSMVRAAQRVTLARWQAKTLLPGQSCTIWGSRAQGFDGGSTPANTNDGDLSRNVVCNLQINRGGVVDSETFPWPACGFVRRVVASEVVVSAIGTPTFTNNIGDVSGYLLAAAVNDGEDPEDCSTRNQYYSQTPVEGLYYGNQGIPPIGVREFRLQIIPTVGNGTNGLFNFGVIQAGNVPVQGSDGLLFQECLDWTIWPQRYSAFVWTPDTATAWLGIQFRV